jgi:hypothetical protein
MKSEIAIERSCLDFVITASKARAGVYTGKFHVKRHAARVWGKLQGYRVPNAPLAFRKNNFSLF